jgi:hypothetical protein
VQYQGSECVCSLSSFCTAPTGLFLDVNHTTEHRFSKEMYNGSIPPIMILGWKGGCYPLESLLLSTLECFYNLTCLTFIVSNNTLIQPLDVNKQKHPTSTTILDLLSELFINDWNSTISYEKYIEECAPKFCTYSYTTRKIFVQIVTILFGLIGGLTIGLELIIGEVILPLFIFIMKRREIRRQVIPCNSNSGNTITNIAQGKDLQKLPTNKRKRANFFSLNLDLWQQPL